VVVVWEWWCEAGLLVVWCVVGGGVWVVVVCGWWWCVGGGGVRLVVLCGWWRCVAGGGVHEVGGVRLMVRGWWCEACGMRLVA
jgi:hypothetical protein